MVELEVGKGVAETHSLVADTRHGRKNGMRRGAKNTYTEKKRERARNGAIRQTNKKIHEMKEG